MKTIIQHHFSVSSLLYDDEAVIQKTCARLLVDRLISFMPSFYPASILDIGAGTGYVSEILLQHFPHSAYTLNDLAQPMLDQAQYKLQSYPDITYQPGDMETEAFQPHDLVISNMAFQWADTIYHTLHRLYALSNVLAFTTLVHGHFREWHDLLNQYGVPTLMHYPEIQDLKARVQSFAAEQMVFETLALPMSFKNVRAFLHHLKRLGALTARYSVPLHTLRRVIQTHHEPFHITWKVVLCLLKRG